MANSAADYLDFLKNNLPWLRETCAPQWHPLGFLFSAIGECGQGGALRVHYWPPEERRVQNPDWLIHTHAYHLSSLVINGSVRDLQYRIVPGSKHTVFEVKYSGQTSELVRRGDLVDTIVELDEIRQAGEEYEVPRGTFHQTEVPFNASAVTLALMTNQGSLAPLVLGTMNGHKYEYDRVQYESEVFWNAVESALLTTE